jgi:hypothetical protein
MKLYKYRSLANFDFVLDIVLNERLHCAPYEKLNDPFEGVFLSAIHMPLVLHGIAPPMVGGRKFTKSSSISELPFVGKTRVCSLSASLSDVRLWSHYADGHKGVAIEIDFSGIENQVFAVEYVPKLKEFGISLLASPESEDVLKLKTSHWEYEKEYRILAEQEYFPVHKRISAVYLGLRVAELHRQLLLRVVSLDIPVFSTKLNETRVTVEPNIQLNHDADSAGAPFAPVG